MAGTEPLSGSDQFARLLKLQAERKLPPVSSWNPTREGSIDIAIDVDGHWLHEGQPIKRKELAKLFASILRYENGHYYLVTPAEKLAIKVADAPFLAVDMEVRQSTQGQEIGFLTNMGEFVVVDEDHPLSVRNTRPYVCVRDGLDALISRSVYYRLVELAEASPRKDGTLGVTSRGRYFELGSEK